MQKGNLTATAKPREVGIASTTYMRSGLMAVYTGTMQAYPLGRETLDFFTEIPGFGQTNDTAKGYVAVQAAPPAWKLLCLLGFNIAPVNWERVKDEHIVEKRGISIAVVPDEPSIDTPTTLADVDALATLYLKRMKAEVKAEVIAEAQAHAKAKAEELKANAEASKKAKATS